MPLIRTKLGQICLCGAVLAIATVSARAQLTILSERDFYRAVARYQTVTDAVPHREVTKSEEFVGDKTVKTVETVREWDGSGNYRVITKEVVGSKTSTTESIWLGSIQYHRIGAGSWTKTDWSKGGTGGSGMGSAEASFYTLEERNHDSIKYQVFTSHYTWDIGTAKLIDVTATYVDRLFWRHRVERTQSHDTPKNVISKSVTSFDYNPGTIELKAPIK